MKKKQIILISIISAVLLAVVISLFIFTPLKNIFRGSISGTSLSSAIQSGKIEVLSESDASSYFTFVSVDEARKMLEDADTSGQFKFLMPQFDASSLKGITIKNEDKETESGIVRFLTISGLPAGTTIYTNSDKFGQGGTTSGSNAFAWFHTKNMGEPLEAITYIPVSFALSAGQKIFLSKIDDVFREVPLNTPIFKLATDLPLSGDLFPAGNEVAYSIAKDDDRNLADLKNVLMKDGKIVMIKR